LVETIRSKSRSSIASSVTVGAPTPALLKAPIEPAHGVDRVPRRGDHLGLDAHVGAQADAAGTGRADRGGGPFDRRGVDVPQRDAGAAGREFDRGGLADARCSAGDDQASSLEYLFHRLSSAG
jgi:hypothetical protein